MHIMKLKTISSMEEAIELADVIKAAYELDRSQPHEESTVDTKDFLALAQAHRNGVLSSDEILGLARYIGNYHAVTERVPGLPPEINLVTLVGSSISCWQESCIFGLIPNELYREIMSYAH